MGKHVFISYSRRDIEYVDRLVAYLTAGGVPVRVDHQLHYGDHWPTVIDGEIEDCAAVVAVMTPDGQRSTWVGKEIDLARQLRRPVVPLLLSGEPFRQLADLRHDGVTDVTDGTMPPPAVLHRLLNLSASSAPGGVYGAPREPAATPAPPSLLANLFTLILVLGGFAATFGGVALTMRALGYAAGAPAAGGIWAVVGSLMIIGGLMAFLAGARRRPALPHPSPTPHPRRS